MTGLAIYWGAIAAFMLYRSNEPKLGMVLLLIGISLGYDLNRWLDELTDTDENWWNGRIQFGTGREWRWRIGGILIGVGVSLFMDWLLRR